MKHAGSGPRRRPSDPGGRCALDRSLPRLLAVAPVCSRNNSYKTPRVGRACRTTFGSKRVISYRSAGVGIESSERTVGVSCGHGLVEAGVRRRAQEEAARGGPRRVHLRDT